MSEYQTTISRNVHLIGTDLFRGGKCEVEFAPAPAGSGIVFFVDKEREAIAANLTNAKRESRNFISSIFLKNEGSENSAGLVEHLLSPLYALGIDNVRVALPNGICPTFNDIALTYYTALKQVLKQQNVPRKLYTLKEDNPYIGFANEPRGLLGRATQAVGLRVPELTKNDRLIVQSSKDGAFALRYDAYYPQPSVGSQSSRFRFGLDDYAYTIARARTFCFPGYKMIHDLIIELGENGWHGVTDANCAFVVNNLGHYANTIEPHGRNGKQEFVNHKLLDATGEFSLLGKRFVKTEARFTQTGHGSSLKLLSEFSKGGYIVEVE